MEDDKKVPAIRALHKEVARHFEGVSEVERQYSMDAISVNGMCYTEEEFTELLEVLETFVQLEANRMKRLAELAADLISSR